MNMKLTLAHNTTQEQAIEKIDDYLNELMKREFPGVVVIDPQKEWRGNFMRFSFAVQKLIFTLEFSGTVLVTDQEVIGEAEIPGMVTTFVSEEKIKEVITKKFNEIFNIN